MQIAAIASTVLVLCIVILLYQKKTGLHENKNRRAQKVFDNLNKGPMEVPRTLAYLRRVDPYVFEELIIIALKQKGCVARHGSAYSGDGGIDGEATIGGEHYFIQAKRYKKHISSDHVKDFAYKCYRHECKGLFVHTGKTGKSSWNTMEANERITIISGQKLIDLIDKTKPLNL